MQYSVLRDYVVKLQSTNPNTIIKITVEGNTDPFLPTMVFQRIYVCLGALKFGFRACRRNLLGLDGAFMKGPFPSQVLAAVGLDSNNGIYPLVYALVEPESKSSCCWFLQCLGDDIDLHPNSSFTFISDRQKISIMLHLYCLQHIHENMKQGWCGQAHKDLLLRAASATSVKEFEKCRAKYDLLLNNICEVFNSKIVGGRDKPVITLLEIMKSIKKEAHLMKVQWNGANKYQVSSSLTCWNMALNNQAAPPLEAWVNPCYWLTTQREIYSHKVQPISETKYWEKSTCPTTLLPPKHHVQVGRPRKKRKRSKHEEELFMKNGKLSKKRITITCQSYGNNRHNKATCKGQGGNNSRANGSASRQAQQAKLVVSQDGSGGSGVGDVIGLSVVDGASVAGSTCVGVGVGSQGSSHSRWTNRIVQIVRISSQKRTPIQLSTNSQVPVSETRNADEIKMGDGIPTQSSAAGGTSEIDNGSLFMVDEEDLTFKKLAPMAKEIIMLSEVRDIVWYTDEIREHVQKVADGWRDTVSYFVKNAVKKYADDE
ncbi:heat stress transcription factor B-4-like protein [Tanacetum coccineum]